MMNQSSISTFPNIDGLIARYSARGLTNEQMSQTNIWKDLSGNGHDITLHNFAWGGMSGIGMYVVDYNSWNNYISQADFTHTASKYNITKIKATSQFTTSFQGCKAHTIKITGLTNAQTLKIAEYNNSAANKTYLIAAKDGIYDIPEVNSRVGYSLTLVQESCNITIEQIPEHKGALVSDGVDDYGICENFPILTKEKGYTVVAVRKWLSENQGYFVSKSIDNPSSGGAFIMEDVIPKDTYSFGMKSAVQVFPELFTYQTSVSYNGININQGDLTDNESLVVFNAYTNAISSTFSQVALYDLLIYSRDLTEEEIGKIKTYFAKIHPDLSIN